MTTPAVTVLIDTYNHERFIEQAIVSVLEQDFPSDQIEILVVDDGSTDRTPEIVRKFEPRVRLLRKVNGGQASAFNAGIPEARGEIIAFLDGDDWWAPKKLSRVMEYLMAHPEVGVLGHGFYEVDSVLGHTVATAPPNSHEISFASLGDTELFRRMMCFFGTSRVVIRKEIAERVLPIPDSIVIEADEFLSIMSIAYSRAVLLPDLLTFYRLHEDNLYQIRSADPRKLRRMHQSIATLARELPPRLAHAAVGPEEIRVLVDTLEYGARKLKLQLDGGMPWETFRVEKAERRFLFSGGSLGYRLFQSFSLGLALMMPPRQYYRLRGWYGLSRLRKLRDTLGEPIPHVRINKEHQKGNSTREKEVHSTVVRKRLGITKLLESVRERGRAAVRRVMLRFKLGKSRRWIELSHEVQGWLTDTEAAELFYLARTLTPSTNPVVVELGSWLGKSSVVLAGGLLGKQNAKMYCIDPFGSDENAEYQQKYYDPLLAGKSQTSEQIFATNAKKSGVTHIVVAMKGYSFDFADSWSVPIDVLFIDANHEYEAVARDFQMWITHVKDGGIVAFHDANGSWPGPTRVVNESLAGFKFGRVHKADSIAWATKRYK
jgi:glycosyltransferase involved in cell wall biosynthesis/predicted O-methyltransferase YrrM